MNPFKCLLSTLTIPWFVACGTPKVPSEPGGDKPSLLCTQFSAPSIIGQFAHTGLRNGPSGIVASRQHQGVLYAHLDAGGASVIYALTADGRDLGAITLVGQSQVDWEDLAIGQGPDANNYLYVADIGDNAARQGGTPRTEIRIIRFLEPEINESDSPTNRSVSDFTTLRFRYPNGAHDAETLFIDPITKDILILTKENNGISQLYRAANTSPGDLITVLELVGTVDIGPAGQGGQASAGDVSPSGDRFVVRTYTSVLLWPRANSVAETFSVPPISVPSANELQSEGISFTGNGDGIISAGERSTNIYLATTNCTK